MLDNILLGIQTVASLESLLAILAGLVCGIIIGAIPGLTADLAIILCLPITYTMDPIPAILLCLGLYCGGTYGGSITAILINTPGTPANAATLLDGYPLTKQGKPLKALTMALYASFVGGIFSALVLLFAAPNIAKITMQFGPPEYFCIAVFGLSIIASVSNGNVAKGLIGAILGVFVAIIGMDSVSGTVRFSFGIRKLAGGVPLIVTLVGLFALAELLTKSSYDPRNDPSRSQRLTIDHERLSWSEIKRSLRHMFVSSIIGTLVGATPGTGGGIAAFISYDQAKKTSKNSENFGKGEIEGIAASEAANNATTGSTMIPLLTLGIPGDGVTAILLGALMLQGMVPGPSLFVNSADIIYGIMVGLLVVNVLMLVIGRLFTPIYANITRIPYELMSAMIVVYCFAGTYSSNSSTFHVLVAVVIGIISYTLRKLDFPIVPIILGVVLGQLTELNFRRSMVMSDGSYSIFFTRPFSLIFLALAILSIVWAVYRSIKPKKAPQQAAGGTQ